MADERDNVTIALVQMSCREDPWLNLGKALARIEDAARGGAQIVCLQELFRSRYPCQSEDVRFFDLAEPIPGPTTERLAPLARSLGKVIVASIFERRTAGVYHNTAVVFDADGSMVGIYRKMHIPDDPLFYEKYYFTPGDLGFRAFDTRFGRIGVLVCWDQWFPEARRLTAMQGAQVLIYPTAIGWHPREKAEFASPSARPGKPSSAHTPSPTACTSPRSIGPATKGRRKPGLEFWGASFVSDPFGVVLAKGPHDQEDIVVAECDPARIEEVRRNWPFLRDRRIDAYGNLTRRFRV